MTIVPPENDPRFCAGLAHFAAHEWFEAHEVWEDLWRGLKGEDRLFVQALIQAAVALHHFDRGNVPGAAALEAAVVAKLSLAPPVRFGLDLEAFSAEFADRLRPLHVPGAPPKPPPRLRRV